MKQRKWQYMVTACCVVTTMTFGTVMADDSAGRLPTEQEKVTMGEPPTPREETNVTDELKVKVKEILNKYDADNLTKEDAIAINNGFRGAGIRKGSAQRQAIIAAGFNPQTISSLDPPPERKKDIPFMQKKNPEQKTSTP